MNITTPQMILEERAASNGLTHSLNADGGGTLWLSCSCITCRNYFDPTGKEDARKRNEAMFKQMLAESKELLDVLGRYAELPSFKRDEIFQYKYHAAHMAHIRLKVAVGAFEAAVVRM